MKRQSIQPYWGSLTEAYVIPKDEAKLSCESGCSPVYGEVSEQGIMEIMDEIPLRYGNFADLGSGRANVTAFVAHNYGFQKCYGVEISKMRHEIATGLVAEAQNLSGMGKVVLINQDLFSFDLKKHDIDVMFCDNLAFKKDGLDKLAAKVAKEMKCGSFVISMRHMGLDLSQSRLELVNRLSVKTSWSEGCPVYVYRVSR